MIVKIFCAVLVALGVSVAIVLGGLIILASCVSGRKSPLVTIPLMTRTHLFTQIICRDFTYNFSILPSFLNSILIKWRVLCP